MILVNLIDESFTEYKKPHMLLGFPRCSFKCDHEYKSKICQNSELAKAKQIEMPVEDVVARYLSNDITKSIVCAGLEPFDSFHDVIALLTELRSKNGCYDDVVIYTGYVPREIEYQVRQVAKFHNVIIKFGRYIPDKKPHYDEVLGVELASDNQYARKIS